MSVRKYGPLTQTQLVALIVVVVIVVAGVGYYQSTRPPPAKATLVVGTTDKVQSTLDPADAYDYFGGNTIFNIMEGLVNYEPGTDKVIPWLATSWQISSDGLTYTFVLRQGVKFHDGSDLDSSVVKFSLDRAIKLNGDPSFLLSDAVASVSAPDKFTVVIKLKEPWSAFMSVVGFTVSFAVSPKTLADKFVDPTALGPAGTGPYRLTRFVKDDVIELRAFEGYWGTKPKTSTVIIKYYKDETGLRLAIETGEIDVAYRSLGPTDLDSLRKNDKVQVLSNPSPVIRYLVLNQKRAPLNNTNVRRAIAAALDRAPIVNKVFQGTVSPLYSMIPIGMLGHTDEFKAQWPDANLELVNKQLGLAGYKPTDKVELDLWFTPVRYGATEPDVAAVMKEAMEKTGRFKINLKSAEWSTYRQNRKDGTMPMYLLGWFPDYLDPDDYTYPFWHSSGNTWLNIGYKNLEVDKLLQQARTETDPAKRAQIYAKAQEVAAQDVAQIPLWQSNQFAVIRKGVQGVLLEPTQWFRLYTIWAPG